MTIETKALVISEELKRKVLKQSNRLKFRILFWINAILILVSNYYYLLLP